MKTILALIAALTVFGIATPNTARADHDSCGMRRVVSYLPCGRPVYAYYRVIGYDRCGNPVGQWVTDRPSCGCSLCNPRPDYGSGHHHHHDDCDRGYNGYNGYNGYHGSGIRWSFSFGR